MKAMGGWRYIEGELERKGECNRERESERETEIDRKGEQMRGIESEGYKDGYFHIRFTKRLCVC